MQSLQELKRKVQNNFMKQKLLNIKKKIDQNDFWKNLCKNSFFAFAGDSVASIINLIISVVLIKLIGNFGYGILILSQSYMQIMDILLNIQSWKSIIQFGQKALVEKNITKLCSYVKIGTLLDISTAIVGGIIAFLSADLIGFFLGWSNELICCAKIFSITIFSHFSGTPTAILRISNRFNLVALQKIIASILKLGSLGVILILKSNIGITNAVIIYVITDIIGNLLLVIFALYVFNKNYGIKNLLCSRIPEDYKEFIKYTLWGTLTEIVDIPINYFDVFIVSILGTQFVSVFKVFKQIVSILSKVTTPIYQAIMPQFSMLTAQGNKEKGYNIVLKIRNAILIVSIPGSLILGFSSPLWLNIIYGEFYAHYWYVLTLFLLIQSLVLSYTTIHPYFLALGKTKESAIYVLISNIIYILFALTFIKIGGMLTLVLCYLVQSVIVIFLKINNIKKTNRK